MRYFPIALDLAERQALVIGADGEAPRVVERLLEAGARVTVIAPGGVHEAIEQASEADLLQLHRRPFEDEDLEGKAIVFLVPGDDALAERLHGELSQKERLFCALDRPERSNFINPAVVYAAGITMSFGSDGASPGALRRIREDLAELFSDPQLARFLEALHKLRESLPRGEERTERMRAALEGFGIEAKLRLPAWFEQGEEP